MRKHLTALCAGLALMTATATAQPPYRKFINLKNKVGKVEFHSSNYGLFGLDVERGDGGFIYPRGSNRIYIFGAGLWFGAKKRVEGELRPLTFITNDPNAGSSWASPSEYDTVRLSPSMYNSTEHDPVTGLYTGNGPRPDWPLWLEPGEKASPMNPGTYEPIPDKRTRQGGIYSRPAFIPGVDEQIVSFYHDNDVSIYAIRDSTLLRGFPLGLQIQQNILSWADGLYAPVVLIQYQIVNTSSDTLHDCVAGQASDIDIGEPGNGRIRYYSERPELRAGLVWNGQQPIGLGVMGTALIEAPVTDAQGFIDNSNRNSYWLQGRVGAFPEWTLRNDPVGSAARYEFMTSGMFAKDDSASDKRTLLASTTFSMRPGDTAYFTMAYIVLDSLPEFGKAGLDHGKHGLASVPTSTGASQLERVITSLTTDYYERGTFASEMASSAPSMPESETGMTLAAMPNPTSDHTTIRLNLSRPADARLRIINSMGEDVLVRDLGTRQAGQYDETIDASGLPAGLYFAIVESGGHVSTIRFAVMR